MMNFIVTSFVLLTLLINKNLALDAENYTTYIEELSRDEKFHNEYTKWSFKLFSHSDYLYGTSHKLYSCPSIEKTHSNVSIPTSVHTLRPNDVKCIGAIGDSLTAGLGAHAITPLGLLDESRGEFISKKKISFFEIFVFRYFMVYWWRLYLFKDSFFTQYFTSV